MHAPDEMSRRQRRLPHKAPLALALAAALLMTTAVEPPAAGATDVGLGVPVLMYHRIHQAPSGAALPALWVAPRRFRAHMRTLAARGWRSITAAELAAAVRVGRSVGPKRFVVTFDDGARDGYRYAAPTLERFGFRGTYCVTPGRAHRPWQISFAQMRDLQARGHEIANHSLSHADLPSLGPRRLRRHVYGAARLIGTRVGRAPRTFCYPYGRHDAAVRRAVRRSGHCIAFTTVEGARQTRHNTMRSPRIRVSGHLGARALLARMRPYARGGGPEPEPVYYPAGGPSSAVMAGDCLPGS